MYLGRYFQGQIVAIVVRTVNNDGTPAAPDNPPYIDLRDDDGQIRQVQAPIVDRYVVTGLFIYPLRLDASFPAGRYTATAFYRVSGAANYHGIDSDVFEVVSGGDPDGAIVTQHYWSRPEAVFLVQQTEAENLLLRRNPYL